MRIGLVTPAWPGETAANGIATAVMHLSAALEDLGHEVTLIPIRLDAAGDSRVVALPPARNLSVGERILMRLGRDVVQDVLAERLAAAAREAVRRRKIEVLVIEETQGWAAQVQRAVPIPVVVTLHGPWFLHKAMQSAGTTASDARRERREADAFRTCAGITAPSRDVLARTEATHDLSSRPRAVIPNPIPLKRSVDHVGLDDRARRTLLFVGRFDRHKGGDTMIEAFGELIRLGVDAHLTFVGPDHGVPRPGAEPFRIHDALAALPAEARRRIDYRGPCAKGDIEALRLRHPIAVVASRYENFPYTLLESMAAGAATIGTAAGGQTEIVRDGETGLLVPPSDPSALAAACRRVLESPDLAARMGAAARNDVAARFAPREIARQMCEFLETIRTSFASAADGGSD